MAHDIARQRAYTISAFLVAVWFPALLVGLSEVSFSRFDARALATWTCFVAFFTFWAVVLLGIPLYLILLRSSLVRWWTSMFAGAAIAAVVLIVLGAEPRYWEMLFYAALGPMTGLAFWIVWRRGQLA